MTEIPWHLEKHPVNNTYQIVIEKCPKCGRKGNLTRAGKGAYRIRHKTDRHTNVGCRFGVCDEYHVELDRIWKKVRGRQHSKLSERIRREKEDK